ncbi:MAG: MAPEG family protein [Nitratireductor sp.]
MLSITTLFASLLGLLFIVLTMRVIKQRGISKVSLSDGGDEMMLRRIRGQANFIEYAPLFLILFGLAEFNGTHQTLLAVLAAAFFISRVMHGYALSFSAKSFVNRFYGTLITGICFITICIINLLLALKVMPQVLLA